MKTILIFLLVVTLSSATSFADSNGKANALYVGAAQLFKKVPDFDKIDDRGGEAFVQALAMLDRIVSDYPESDLAVKLVQNAPVFRGMSLDQLHAMMAAGQKILMGERVKVTAKESVNFVGAATEADARKLGNILKASGYFDGSKEVDVILKNDAKEGTVVSFIINGLGKDAAISNAFKVIGEGIAKDGFGKPLTIRLMDSHLNTLKDIKVE